MTPEGKQKELDEILSMDEDNSFLRYITNRLRNNDYRGWHVSQHNRYDLDDISSILENIHRISGTDYFAIPPGDYKKDTKLPNGFQKFQAIIIGIHSEMGRGTINSIKKNFFPDLEGMGFLLREKKKLGRKGRTILHGKLTSSAVEFINAAILIDKYKKFTDAIDKLFGNKISELVETINLSDYRDSPISIYEFMFILSDKNEDIDKIQLLDSYRRLEKYKRRKLISLLQEYAKPENFEGNKTARRDFHNWKNQAQQMMSLLRTTVYFEVDQNKYFRLNVGKTGFFQPLSKRSDIPKRRYFDFHKIRKRDRFELHHIVPISSARNREEAKMIDDHLNLIYIHRGKHRAISKNQNKTVVLTIYPKEAIFSDFEDEQQVKTINDKDALYTTEQKKIKKIAKYNRDLLKAIFEFEKSQ